MVSALVYQKLCTNCAGFILNKADLYTKKDLAKNVADIRERFGNVAVLTTSTKTEAGLHELISYIQPGLTYCFVGSSGVGKSTMINALLQQNDIATSEISKKTGRGMHTTTARQMYIMSNGGIIIDNPGSREVGVVSASSSDVGEVFDDIIDLVRACRFNNCSHTNEPVCAIRRAIDTGSLDRGRYDNYQRLQKEAAHREMNAYARRQKDKKFGKMIKKVKSEHAYDDI